MVLNLDNSDNRRAVEFCYRTTTALINPIIDWTDSDVWEFLNHYGCKSNPLYQCGQGRIGCVGCPLGGYKSMKRELQLYPKYKENYIRAFDRMIKARKDNGLKVVWNTGEEVLHWWVSDIKKIEGQTLFEGFDFLDV